MDTDVLDEMMCVLSGYDLHNDFVAFSVHRLRQVGEMLWSELAWTADPVALSLSLSLSLSLFRRSLANLLSSSCSIDHGHVAIAKAAVDSVAQKRALVTAQLSRRQGAVGRARTQFPDAAQEEVGS